MTTPTDKSEVSSRQIDPIDAEQTASNHMDDVSHLLNEKQRIWMELYRATQGSYCGWVPRWAWHLYKDKCPNLDCIDSLADVDTDQLTDLRAQVERLHADGAVMRQSIEDFVYNVKHSHVAGWGDVSKDTVADNSFQELSKSLSADAGRDLLARYREAVWLLRNASISQSQEWADRRDTLLATVKGGDL